MTQGSKGARPVQLHVIHDLGGGSTKWLRDYAKADETRTNLVLRSFAHDTAMAAGVALYADVFTEEPIALWKFSQKIAATVTSHAEYRAALDEVIRGHGVQALIVSSTIGHSLEVLDTGIPTAVVFHDYFPWCPAINLYFGGICTSCEAPRLTECARENSDFNPFAGFPARRAPRGARPLRGARPAAAREARRPERIGGGQPQAHRDAIRGPRLRGRPARLRRSIAARESRTLQSRGAPARPRAGAALGRQGPEAARGGTPPDHRVRRCHDARHARAGRVFQHSRHVQVVPEYELSELPGHIAAIRPHVALLTSIVPESFGYALSELFMLGVPVLATRVGAYADRISNGVNGYLCPPEAAAIAGALGAIAADRGSLERVRAGLASFRHRSAAEMVADYHRLLPLAAPSTSPAPLPPRDDAEAVEAVTIASMWKHVRATSLQMTIINDARQRGENGNGARSAARSASTSGRLARRAPPRRAHQALLAHKEMQLQHLDRQLQIEGARLDEIFSSTSWRFSAGCAGWATASP